MGTTTQIQPNKHQIAGGDGVDFNIPPALVGGGSAAAMFAGLFWMLARDHLVTGPAHRRELAMKDQQIADKDTQIVMWRAVGETSNAQMLELLEHSRLSVQLLQGIDARSREAKS